jgi:hypothetical protein
MVRGIVLNTTFNNISVNIVVVSFIGVGNRRKHQSKGLTTPSKSPLFKLKKEPEDALVVVSVVVLVKLVVVVIRARKLVQVVLLKSVLKVVKCPFSVACPRLVFHRVFRLLLLK